MIGAREEETLLEKTPVEAVGLAAEDPTELESCVEGLGTVTEAPYVLEVRDVSVSDEIELAA